MSTLDFLIKNARLTNGVVSDIGISNGVITEIGQDSQSSAKNTVDASNCIVLPGLVDLHTHLREPGREDAETVESGSRAGAKGGFTAVSAMANTSPVADTAGVA
jgi:dihydroorotase